MCFSHMRELWFYGFSGRKKKFLNDIFSEVQATAIDSETLKLVLG